MNDKDYLVFLRYLKEYLLPEEDHKRKELLKNTPRRKPINCSDDIDLLAYCLIPNHFHLFVKQKTNEGLKSFMKALMTNYVMYFNHRYNRQGPLFQGVYKAVRIKSDSQFLHITRYIHRNPSESLEPGQALKDYPYSSYKFYLDGLDVNWIDTATILKMFRNSKDKNLQTKHSYQYFVEKYKPSHKPFVDVLFE